MLFLIYQISHLKSGFIAILMISLEKVAAENELVSPWHMTNASQYTNYRDPQYPMPPLYAAYYASSVGQEMNDKNIWMVDRDRAMLLR